MYRMNGDPRSSSQARAVSGRWPINMTEAGHIASIPQHDGTDAEIAREYRISERLVHDLRAGCGFNGVALPVVRLMGRLAR